MLRAIVFDFDGVIANSEPLHFSAFRDVLNEDGVVLTEADYYARYLGYDDVGVFEAVGAAHGQWTRERVADLVARKAVRLEALERNGSILSRGGRRHSARVARSDCDCLLASASRFGACPARAPDRCFTAIVAAEDVPVKAGARSYLRAVVLLRDACGGRLAPADCVAIEDSRGDWSRTRRGIADRGRDSNVRGIRARRRRRSDHRLVGCSRPGGAGPPLYVGHRFTRATGGHPSTWILRASRLVITRERGERQRHSGDRGAARPPAGHSRQLVG